MTKIFVIGIGMAELPMMAARIASAGLDAEVVPVLSIDDIPIPEMERDDLVLNLSGEENFRLRAEELELTLMDESLIYNEPDKKTTKKIERRQNREFRSKKDRRNHK